MAKKNIKTYTSTVFEAPLLAEKDELIVEGLRQNNLKNLSLRIPHNKITTVVGPSGSGKSSLVFDTLFAEGRWRFIESLSTYTRLFLERMDRPDLDSIRNVRPAIAVEQKNPVRTSRSTVGTATELNDYLRLLFARAGKVHCPECGSPVKSYDPESAADELIPGNKGKQALIGFSLSTKGKTPEEISEALLRKGFIRVKVKERVFNLSEEPLTGHIPPEINIIADRLTLTEEERGRLVESLETSFKEGSGVAWAELPKKTIKRFSEVLTCEKCGISIEKPTPLSLSFNHPVGACPGCKGFGNVLEYDEDKIVPDHNLTLRQGAIEPWTKPAYRWWYEELEGNASKYDIDLDKPFFKLSRREKDLVFKGTKDFDGVNGFFAYLETKKYKLHIKVFISRYKWPVLCRSCRGVRLKKSALSMRINGLNIADVSRMTIKEACGFFEDLRLTPFEKEVSKEILKQILAKLEFLSETGLGYITLDRLTKTLSGGEAQRVAIATQLASSLCGVLYILDEPSVGLHPVDIDNLTDQIKKLSSMGNTVVTVEHDPAVIMKSDYIVELGPGAGERGGRLVYSGPFEDFISGARTLTSDYLSGRLFIHVPRWRRKGSGKALSLTGASGNNLRDIDIKIPLKTMTCVTGVSGSGKSTLVVDTLYNIAAAHFGARHEKPLPCKTIEGLEQISGVKLIDQGPIGRTPRSNPLTYIGGFDEIRHIFAGLPSARSQGLTPGHFSFNVPGGRCETCKGEGVEKLEMYFLPDIYIKCAACNWRRYKTQVLEVKYRDKSIFDCLEMTFDEAIRLFQSEQNLQKKFSIIREVGLGYLKLGQSALTLSGGEAQRLKIARELSDEEKNDILYILDEPTTGLHMDDIKKLLSVLGRLVDSGGTVLVIEHNLDCIKTADHIIDLGPGGGVYGGRVVGSGPPEEIAKIKKSLTGRYLKKVL